METLLKENELKIYNSKISDFLDRANHAKDYKEKREILEKLGGYQNEFMEDILKRYERTIGNNDAKRVIYSVLEYAVNTSVSGSSICCVKDDKLAHEVEEIIWEEIGDFLLDYEIYEDSDGLWTIDCMFAGAFVPYWDGFDDIEEIE